MGNVFTTPIEVRFRDIDAMGHVNNAVYFTYFEEGRKRLFHSFSQSEDPTALGIILAHIECDYLRPIKLTTKVVLQTWITAIGTKIFQMAYRIVDAVSEKETYARGDSVLVCFDYRRDRSTEISKELRNRLEGYLSD